MEEWVAPVMRQIWNALSLDGTPHEVLSTFLDGLLAAVVEAPMLPWLWSHEILNAGGCLRQKVVAHIPKQRFTTLCNVFAVVQKNGNVRGDVIPSFVLTAVMGVVILPLAARDVFEGVTAVSMPDREALRRHALHPPAPYDEAGRRNTVPVRLFIALVACFLTACVDTGDTAFQGYVEGDYIYLASARAGRLEALPQPKGTLVGRNAVLCYLESDYERQALSAAEANLDAAKATLEDMEHGRRPEEVSMAKAQLRQAKADASNAQQQLRRYEALRKSGGVSQRALDDARARAKTTSARVAELESQVDVFNLPERDYRLKAQRSLVAAELAHVGQARWDLAQKELKAPAAGLIVDTLYREGEWIAAGSPVIQLLPPGNVKVRFFVPEKQLSRLYPGMELPCRVDGRDTDFSVSISWISPEAEYTPPIIYSNETRSKLCFMVEARPKAAVAATLNPGQPLTVFLP